HGLESGPVRIGWRPLQGHGRHPDARLTGRVGTNRRAHATDGQLAALWQGRMRALPSPVYLACAFLHKPSKIAVNCQKFFFKIPFSNAEMMDGV
ncbi:MAG TPA: hypothetical protein VMT24_04205, partial [Aggregatilineaceae bacterium]|nr:hypothetical protein [Aggregatilineaceae bacterium]